ncbi:hypothetical protein WR31_27995 [Burkholderia contaminans LMG 23361]|uniref:Uncharacterized protein n=1 Tax=Burkholderia contaminans LMG 23361 TaxID=1334628 RepID=A0ABD4ANN1_9BURK|nr:hypothetical protein WR31_27995 [Burkholderia contaminans LMG 23361]KVS00463.1 hypothetical protein WK29_00080 [Burkholderia vietnamiensis]
MALADITSVPKGVAPRLGVDRLDGVGDNCFNAELPELRACVTRVAAIDSIRNPGFSRVAQFFDTHHLRNNRQLQ